MKSFKYFIITLLILAFSCLSLMPLQGQAIKTGLEETAGRAGLSQQEPAVAIGVIIFFFLSFLGVILLIILIYAGFLWMTAGGDDEQVRKAKSWIINGMIGLAITILAYAIANYVLERIAIATGT